MNAKELAKFDGKEGRKAYIAFKGQVYDATESKLWKNGEHEEIHLAGLDLTDAMSGAPHGEKVFEKLNVVDQFQENEADAAEKEKKSDQVGSTTSSAFAFLQSNKPQIRYWYQKYHPHPLTVHFPIALHIFAAGVDLMFLATMKPAYEVSVFLAFFVATLMGLVAMAPGILSWWVNYAFLKARPFMVKLYVAILTVFLGFIGIGIRIADPNVAYHPTFEGILYHFTIFVTVPMVVILGYYGGKITWPDPENKADGEEKTEEP